MFLVISPFVESMCFLSFSVFHSFCMFFFFQVPIYLNSFPPFFFLLHWFPNPSLCMQLGPSCVSVTVCANICVFVWLFLARCCQWAEHTVHKRLEQQKPERERERRRRAYHGWDVHALKTWGAGLSALVADVTALSEEGGTDAIYGF